MAVLLLFSGFQDSSSHKLSSQVFCKTMLESMLSLLMNLILRLKFMMKLPHRKFLRSLKMVVSFMVCILKVQDGIILLTCWTIQSLSNYILRYRCAGSCPRKIERSQNLASINALFTKSYQEQVLFQQQVTLQTS